jgi:hypothetical protein
MEYARVVVPGTFLAASVYINDWERSRTILILGKLPILLLQVDFSLLL